MKQAALTLALVGLGSVMLTGQRASPVAERTSDRPSSSIVRAQVWEKAVRTHRPGESDEAVRAIEALLMAAVAMPAGRQTTFSARVDTVRVDVLVSDGRQPILGLTADDFDVLDSGVRQKVDLVTFEQVPLDVVLALDMSASVSGERLAELRAGARAAIEALKPKDHVGLLTFNHSVWTRTPLIAEPTSVLSMLNAPVEAGNTSLVDASFTAMVHSEAGDGRPLVIMFSDGLDTASFLDAGTVLQTAKRSNAVVYAVTVEGTVRSSFLHDLSELTGGRVLGVSSIKKLGETLVAILDEFRHRYLISYTPRGVAKAGWHPLDVRVKNRKATIKARPGYVAG